MSGLSSVDLVELLTKGRRMDWPAESTVSSWFLLLSIYTAMSIISESRQLRTKQSRPCFKWPPDQTLRFRKTFVPAGESVVNCSSREVWPLNLIINQCQSLVIVKMAAWAKVISTIADLGVDLVHTKWHTPCVFSCFVIILWDHAWHCLCLVFVW